MRNLWAAVVNQALDDLREFPYGSVEYTQAFEFFTGLGEWQRSREQIADYLELHPDDIRKAGKAVIQARRLVDGGDRPAPRRIALVQPAEAPPAFLPPPPDIRQRLDPTRVQRGLKQPWWLQRKFA